MGAVYSCLNSSVLKGDTCYILLYVNSFMCVMCSFFVLFAEVFLFPFEGDGIHMSIGPCSHGPHLSQSRTDF